MNKTGRNYDATGGKAGAGGSGVALPSQITARIFRRGGGSHYTCTERAKSKTTQAQPERDVLYDVNNLSANLQPVDITACFQGKGIRI
ncbi:hypothetical protein HYZ97_02600 [Candidatus Pacearchaeota archaeon]|nr:hypothetical protein [Candidatus Pacearchaeota archaeon]